MVSWCRGSTHRIRPFSNSRKRSGAILVTVTLIVLTDPDAPTPDRPVAAPFLHWIAAVSPQVGSGRMTSIVHYVPMSPPKGSPPHRYVLQVFNVSLAELKRLVQWLPDYDSLSARPRFPLSKLVHELSGRSPLAVATYWVELVGTKFPYPSFSTQEPEFPTANHVIYFVVI